MKLSTTCLRQVIKESLRTGRLIVERPWSVEIEFKLSGGKASDSEGVSPDGFKIALSDDVGNEIDVVFDTYWNPTNGDKSGNQLYATINGQKMDDGTYVPIRFDDNHPQRVVISNSPTLGMIVVSHCLKGMTPIAYLAFKPEFEMDSDIHVDCEVLGDSEKFDWKLVNQTNI